MYMDLCMEAVPLRILPSGTQDPLYKLVLALLLENEALEDATSHEVLTTLRVTELTGVVNSKDQISKKRNILEPSSPTCLVECNFRVTPVDPYGAEKESSQLQKHENNTFLLF